ncbi:MAG TPA: endolytic transglycosylase MltG [Candidatus Limnocylindria bacterium]
MTTPPGTPPAHGPVRAGPRRPTSRAAPPRRASTRGPVFFALILVVALAAAVALARPLVVDAVVGLADEHDALLRQSLVRSIVGPRVAGETAVAADPNGRAQEFVVRRGETASQIAAELQRAGLIRSALAFKYALYESGRESTLQSGTYTVSPALTPEDIARLFGKAAGDQAALRIIEGWRLTEIATAVAKAFPKIGRDEFAAAAVVGTRNNTVLAGLDPKTSLEGYLFPDTYFLRPDATATQIVDLLLDTFERRVGPALRAAASERKVAIYDIVKLASIVEREAKDRKESPAIAGLYQNRLDIGMKLDADPTIQYALGDWRELSLADLKIDSPYNTYRVAGLPLTPIANAGQAALEAAARPAKNPYFYFVAKNDGTGGHAFAVTLAEQEANRVKYGNK